MSIRRFFALAAVPFARVLISLAILGAVNPSPAPAQVLAIMAPNANATQLAVTSLADSGPGSLREALQTANTGDVIVFAVTGTITLSSTLEIGTSLTINGPGASSLAISGNGGGGVFSVDAGVTATIFGVTIENGFGASLEGGGIQNAGTLTVSSSVLLNNSSFCNGGGISNTGTLTVNNSTLSGNQSGCNGGAISNESGGTVTVSRSTLSGNVVAEFGGGIYNNGNLTLSKSTVSENLSGGGIFNENGGTLTILNSTLSGNETIFGGGAVYNSATLAVVNSTLSGNSGPTGGGIYTNGGTLILKNTIVANALLGGNCSGDITSEGYNLSDDTSCALTGTGDLLDTPAGLDPGGLQNNGGPTQTIALLTSSPAVDAIPIGFCTRAGGVTPVATDQRGVIRPQSPHAKCDIGAYELATAHSLLAALEIQVKASISGESGADMQELENAAKQLSAALAAQNWTGTDGNHLAKNNAAQFFLEEGAAAFDLTVVFYDAGSAIAPGTIQEDLDNLGIANRVLAAVAITDAAGGNPGLLAQANAQLAAGDQATAAGHFDVAITAYAAAWSLAQIVQ